MKAIAFGLVALLVTSPALAQNCHRTTVAKLAAIEAPQADRDTICAAVGLLGNSSEDAYTSRDFANLASAGQRLRDAGYRSRMMHLELVPLEGIRPSNDLALVAAAYVSSKGCVTPALVFQDMTNAVKADAAALKMFRGWDQPSFNRYLAMVGQDNGCTFHAP